MNAQQPAWVAFVVAVFTAIGAIFTYLSGQDTNIGAKGALAVHELRISRCAERITRLETLHELSDDSGAGSDANLDPDIDLEAAARADKQTWYIPSSRTMTMPIDEVQVQEQVKRYDW